MALLNNPPWGNFRGTIGNLVAKVRNGKTYLASIPAFYTTPQDEKSVSIRNKLTFTSKLFSAMGKIYWFKEIWNNTDIRGWNFHNKMNTLNYHLVDMDGTINNIFLVPFGEDIEGFSIQNASVTLEPPILKAEVTIPDGLGDNIHMISAQGVLYLAGCSVKDKYGFQFIPITIEDQIFTAGLTYTFTYKIPPIEVRRLKQYRNRTFLFNLFVKDKTGVPLTASENISASFIEESIIPFTEVTTDEASTENPENMSYSEEFYKKLEKENE